MNDEQYDEMYEMVKSIKSNIGCMTIVICALGGLALLGMFMTFIGF